jgi:hypothetical protein
VYTDTPKRAFEKNLGWDMSTLGTGKIQPTSDSVAQASRLVLRQGEEGGGDSGKSSNGSGRDSSAGNGDKRQAVNVLPFPRLLTRELLAG